MKFLISLMTLIMLATSAYGSEMPTTYSTSPVERVFNLPNPTGIVLYAAITIGILVITSLIMGKGLKNRHKKIIFVLISITTIITTIYLIATAVGLNAVSETRGPVHWHADIQVWACGVNYDFVHSQGLDNKVGIPLMHMHDDNRMHIEGVVVKLSDVNLGNFFGAIGGNFAPGHLTMPTLIGIRTWNNGDLCNDRPAKLYMFVNNKPESSMDNYIISPYFNVPPGDTIKLVFTEKPLNKINPVFGQEP